MRKSTKTGFTLMELLLVIAIVGILGALLIGGMARTQAKTRGIVCVNNLRQHGVAMGVFLADHSEYPLAVNFETNWPSHGRTVFNSLEDAGLGPMPENSAVSKNVHLCPAGVRQRGNLPEGMAGAGLYPGGYAYNVGGLGGPQKSHYAPVKESQVVSPSGMIAVGDGVRGWGRVYEDVVWDLARTVDAKDKYESSARVARLHGGKINILWCDGHVNGMTLDFLFLDSDDAALRVWNRDNQPHREQLEQ